MNEPDRFRSLLSSFEIKSHSLKNRIVFAPVGTRMAHLDGTISEQMLAYYSNQASGGAAMVITETLHVDDIASKYTIIQPAIYHDKYIAGLSSLVDEITKGGSVAIAQIGHAGRQSFYEANNRVPVAPSKIVNGPTRDCHELTGEEIEQIIRSFGKAAYRAEQAGFAGIEIHAGNGYLINEFLSSYTNKRTDEYGKNRALLLVRVIDEVSKTIGKNAIVGVRIGCSDFLEAGLQPQEAVFICSLLPREKIDYIHTSAGTSESSDYSIQPMYHRRALLEEISREIKKTTQFPVILTGSINNVLLAEDLLSKQSADLIGMGRPLLADPDLPKKVLLNRDGEIRPCIRCNQGCVSRVRSLKTIRCSINPNLGYEWTKNAARVKNSLSAKGNRKKRVLIAGAGPAGIIAALQCDELGCAVKLCEKEDRIGGLLNTARSDALKQDLIDYLDYLSKKCETSGVELANLHEVDERMLREEEYDIFINASGSMPIIPSIPENLEYSVIDAREYLFNINKYSKPEQVIILGGGTVGCEIGNLSAVTCRNVRIIEKSSSILPDLNPVSASALRRLLKEKNIRISTDTRFVSFDRTSVITDKGIEPAEGALVVVAMGSYPNPGAASIATETNLQTGKNYLRIGDAKKVGKIHDAVHDAYWSVTSFLSAFL